MSIPIDTALQVVDSISTEDDLFAALGENSVDSMGFEGMSQGDKINAGKSWWGEHAEEIKIAVCRIAADKDASGALVKDIIQVVFGLVGAKYGIGVATYAASIAARRVISGWCEVNADSKA